VATRNYDDWTIDRWRTERRLTGWDALDPDDGTVDEAPPLWKELTLASVVAVLLWVVAAAIFG
jgi:hypothetical protein